MKLTQIYLVISVGIFLVSSPGLVKAQTPGEILIVEALQDIAFTIEELAPAQACRAETTTVLKGIKFTAGHPNEDTARSTARKEIVDSAWSAASGSCMEMNKADGIAVCHVKKGNLDLNKDIDVKCEKAGAVFACDAKLVNDVTYICNT